MQKDIKIWWINEIGLHTKLPYAGKGAKSPKEYLEMFERRGKDIIVHSGEIARILGEKIAGEGKFPLNMRRATRDKLAHEMAKDIVFDYIEAKE